jgi:hypothetical protein
MVHLNDEKVPQPIGSGQRAGARDRRLTRRLRQGFFEINLQRHDPGKRRRACSAIRRRLLYSNDAGATAPE